jgi:hypothetical protein
MPWGFDVTTVAVPTSLWGTEDPSVPVGHQDALELSSRPCPVEPVKRLPSNHQIDARLWQTRRLCGASDTDEPGNSPQHALTHRAHLLIRLDTVHAGATTHKQARQIPWPRANVGDCIRSASTRSRWSDNEHDMHTRICEVGRTGVLADALWHGAGRDGQEAVNQICDLIGRRIQGEVATVNSMHLRRRHITAERFRFGGIE